MTRVSVSVPWLRMPPPALVRPPLIVIPEIATVASEPTSKMPKSGASPRATFSSGPGPEIVVSPVILGSALARKIVPLSSIGIESGPGLPFAAAIAARSDPAPASAALFTGKLVAPAGAVRVSAAMIASRTAVRNRGVGMFQVYGDVGAGVRSS